MSADDPSSLAGWSDAFACAEKGAECLPPSDAFAIVGNETRVRILEALWANEGSRAPFTQLNDAVDVDDSGQFNYHLQKLVGPFVRHEEEGYQLRAAGANVVRSIVAGSFNADPSLEAFGTGEACTACCEELAARYDDEQLAIGCPACGRQHAAYALPPGTLLGRGPEELLDAFDAKVRHDHSLARDGVCPTCGGTIGLSLAPETRPTYTCEQCRRTITSTVGLAVRDQPPVRSFHRDRGVDLAYERFWQRSWCLPRAAVTSRRAEPLRIDARIPLGDEVLEIELDEQLSVVATEIA